VESVWVRDDPNTIRAFDRGLESCLLRGLNRNGHRGGISKPNL